MMIFEKVLFNKIAKVIANFDTLSLEDKLLMILGSQETDNNTLVINYVNKCFEN